MKLIKSDQCIASKNPGGRPAMYAIYNRTDLISLQMHTDRYKLLYNL